MPHPEHTPAPPNRTQTVRFGGALFTSEERDEETCYGYCNEYQPHAVKRMFDYKNGVLYDLRWDDAGNLGQVSMSKPGEIFDAGRFLFWTEDCCGPRPCGANRMHAAVDDRYYSYYVYDHSGGSCGSQEQSQACLSYAEMEQRRRSQRRLKLTGDNKQLDVNADFMVTYTVLNEPTLYPSAYMVLTNKGYTKHYYAGTERVAARIGGGCLKTLEKNPKLQKAADLLFKQSLDQTYERMLKNNDLGCIQNPDEDIPPLHAWIDGIPDRMKARVDVDNSTFRRMICRMTEDCEEEPNVYFYHSDHLGSASWITDSAGIAVQHLQYLPYGEPYINQHPYGYSERFTFTGKEKDEETGYGYFGARYMDHELMTMWLSVDPMSDKYPNISPYNYCMWNPVKLVDPDGRDVYVLTSDGHLRRSEKMTKECEDYKGNDVIYAQSTGEFSKKFKEGYLCDMKCGTQSGKKGSYLILGDNRQDNVDIFKFCAENAETEFSLMEFKMEDGIRTLLTTSHHERTPSSEYVSDEYGSAYAKANVCYLISHIHNHFQMVGASFDQNGNSPDIDFRTMINNIRVCGDEETKNLQCHLEYINAAVMINI